MAQDAFPGFTKETVRFLQELKANNTREWFADNKSAYENAVKAPAQHFCDALTGQLQILTGAAHKSKIFRIHRDLRFSKDKTPYNAHLHISFIPESKMAAPPCWFFGLAPERLTVGAGVFAFDKPALEAYRQRVDGKDGVALAALLDLLKQDGVRIGDIELKRVPTGYAQDHPADRFAAPQGSFGVERFQGHAASGRRECRAKLCIGILRAQTRLRLAIDGLSAPPGRPLAPADIIFRSAKELRQLPNGST